ncbi:hypothetical protein MKW94_008797 [Papaver nudicaule]|uniref:Nuclear speckle splicing regulatory protein 1 N-terminal domain-containing protein n=1 Tax=Papaver nudicaule TaxID=74823 RepID=A0AA41SFR5_PAPNU|nr:hypothetical protein [Papaver nudicaule]
MKNYGLQLRVQPSQQKKQSSKRRPLHPPISSAADDVAFDYDGVYDQMVEATTHNLMQDRQEKKSKYIQTIMAKAKERERDDEVVHERELEISIAYKKNRAKLAKWCYQEKDDVTKKNDIRDFYFNLRKYVTFGAGGSESSVTVKKEVKVDTVTSKIDVSPVIKPPSSSAAEKDGDVPAEINVYTSDRKVVPTDSLHVISNVEPKPIADQSDQDPHKKREAALSAAKERFLVRKRAKQQ